MAVFSQIKNFIKSGKNEHSSLSRRSTAQKYEQAARMVEEENLAKQTMPTYPGLEDYQLTTKLGDGAFSKVYEALQHSTNEKVAIKIVKKKELNNQQKASVLKEAQIMRTLDHPSIITMLDFIETKEHYFLIVELCQGGEIFHQIVRLTYFSEDLSRHCIRQVAEGILYLHEEKGIVHRDIKPENLLFVPIDFKERSTPIPASEFDEPKEDEGEFMPGVGGGGIGAVKIADFGLSKVVWDQQTMTPCGTVGYTAPEIVKDQRYSKSVDMWALGCVLYTLLCGFPPFYDESIQVLTEKVAKGQYTFLSPWWDSISDEAKDLVENLLHVDPDKRFTILEFMAHPWMKNEKMTTLDKEAVETKTINPLDLTKIPMFTSIESTGVPAKDNEETEAEAFKRMIQEHHRDEQELEVATPTMTSSSVINSRVNSRAASRAPSIVASGATTPRRDLFSGVTSMKEMFDISYAVHRMTEEKQRRQQIKQTGGQETPRRSLFMSAVNDMDDDITDDDMTTTDETSSTHDEEDDIEGLESLRNKLKMTQLHEKKHHRSNKDGGLFELNMNNATLLGRRKIPSATEPIDS
ncbi:kinase-like domain-containing protein [Blakeslea trispora]|nr:kinase-like domain-containing protein [Blakeslea trispora]